MRRTITMWRAAIVGLAICIRFLPTAAQAVDVATFDDLTLGSESYWNGSDGSGGFTSEGADFNNNYNSAWGSWDGWSYSNTTDTTTPGFANQYSAYTCGGQGSSANYGVAYVGLADPPTITLPEPGQVYSAYFTNTTYAALSMHNGDAFAKKFGGVSGNDPDWFKMTVTGKCGSVATGSVDFYLADYRFADNSEDYVVDEWTEVDLTSLGRVNKLEFALDSSDVGQWGMNTPAYFAMDNLNGLPPIVDRPPEFHAVLVGMAEPDKWRTMRADKDAEAIYDVLCKYPGANPDNIRLMLSPTGPHAVENTVREVVEQLEPGDQFLFYFAGHGYYLGIGDFQPEPEVSSSDRDDLLAGDEYLYVRGPTYECDISDDLLTTLLFEDPKMDEVSKMIILDTCFAGGFWGREGNDDDEGDLDKLKNIGLLAACGEDGKAFTIPACIPKIGGRGAFSVALERVLDPGGLFFSVADTDNDGALSFDEIRNALDWAYTVEELGDAGIIRGFPWIEEDIEMQIDAFEVYADYGTGFNPGAPIVGASVPEPGTLALLLLGGLCVLVRIRRVRGQTPRGTDISCHISPSLASVAKAVQHFYEHPVRHR